MIDLTNSEFIDSSVVQVLVTRAKAKPGRIVVVMAAGTPPARLFQLLALDDLLPTYTGVPEAISRLSLVHGPGG